MSRFDVAVLTVAVGTMLATGVLVSKAGGAL